MKISIVTATYNSGATVRDTIRSVLEQSYDNIEYIIKDGGSTDDTLNIVRAYEPLFGGRMKVISEPDKGIYDAFNKGLATATGDVVGFLNSDDFFTSPHVVAKLATALADSGCDAVYGDVHYVDIDDISHEVRYYSSAYFRRRLMRCGFMPAHPSWYCRREVYERYGGFDCRFRIAADFENLLRLIFIHRISTVYLPLDCVAMRTGGASTSGMASHRRILKDHLRAYRKDGVYSNFLFESARYAYKVGEVTTYRIKNLIHKYI